MHKFNDEKKKINHIVFVTIKISSLTFLYFLFIIYSSLFLWAFVQRKKNVRFISSQVISACLFFFYCIYLLLCFNFVFILFGLLSALFFMLMKVSTLDRNALIHSSLLFIFRRLFIIIVEVKKKLRWSSAREKKKWSSFG